MYKIKVIHISLLSRINVTEMSIRKYFVLVRHQKLRPKEVNNCYTYQRNCFQNMVNYKLWWLRKYHGLKILVDLRDHMNIKNPNIIYPKKANKEC